MRCASCPARRVRWWHSGAAGGSTTSRLPVAAARCTTGDTVESEWLGAAGDPVRCSAEVGSTTGDATRCITPDCGVVGVACSAACGRACNIRVASPETCGAAFPADALRPSAVDAQVTSPPLSGVDAQATSLWRSDGGSRSLHSGSHAGGGIPARRGLPRCPKGRAFHRPRHVPREMSGRPLRERVRGDCRRDLLHGRHCGSPALRFCAGDGGVRTRLGHWQALDFDGRDGIAQRHPVGIAQRRPGRGQGGGAWRPPPGSVARQALWGSGAQVLRRRRWRPDAPGPLAGARTSTAATDCPSTSGSGLHATSGKVAQRVRGGTVLRPGRGIAFLGVRHNPLRGNGRWRGRGWLSLRGSCYRQIALRFGRRRWWRRVGG